jgi:putative spermidine/putrescine transport system permease protein
MKGRTSYLLMVGAVVLFLVAPLASIVLSSFSGAPMFVFPISAFTLKWYGNLSPVYLDALWVSLQVGLGATSIAVLLGVPAALSLVRGRLPMARTLTTAMLTPLTLPTLVIGVAGLQWFNLLSEIGVPLAQTVPGLILIHSAFTLPLVIRSAINGQLQFDRQIEDAAMSLGATPTRTFLTVTVPLLMPSVASGAILAFLMSFDDVPIALFLGGSDATTLPVQIFNDLQFNLSPEILALSSLITVGVIGLVVISSKMLGLNRLLGGKSAN